MEFRMNGGNYVVAGTPAEMEEFIRITLREQAAYRAIEEMGQPISEPETPAPEVPEAPKKKTRQKAVDWAKAIALRKAGWTYDAIASDLHVSRQNVVNHMKTMGV